jgi:two-component system response regulator PrrA
MESPMTANKPILVVIDDSEIVLGSIKLGLEPLGWSVVPFLPKLGVSARVKDAQPDLILVDVNMPMLSGDAVVRALKQLRLNAKIVLHSGKTAKELRELVRETGADGFVEKSDNPLVLDRKLRPFLPLP